MTEPRLSDTEIATMQQRRQAARANYYGRPAVQTLCDDSDRLLAELRRLRDEVALSHASGYCLGYAEGQAAALRDSIHTSVGDTSTLLLEAPDGN